MSEKLVNTEEALALMKDQGYTYLDVRTAEEFEEGHPEGAYNIPLLMTDPTTGSRVLNPNFVAEVEANFATDQKLVVGCRAGGRSARAVQALTAAGFHELADHYPGWVAFRDGTPGWSVVEGMPIETGQSEGRSHEALKKK